LKTLRVVIAAALGLTMAALAQAATQVSVRFDIGQAPPPQMVFHAEPHVVYMPEERVYVVDDPNAGDYDCFRYDGYWYAFRGGYWYRSSRWNGQFVVIHPARVPVAVYHVPETRWRHHAVWASERKEDRRDARREEDDDRGNHGNHGNHGNKGNHGNHGNHGDHGDQGDHGRDEHGN
jgi:hypothetical protein